MNASTVDDWMYGSFRREDGAARNCAVVRSLLWAQINTKGEDARPHLNQGDGHVNNGS
jgi:hypothetical protein